MGTVLNLYIALGYMATLTMVIFLIHEHRLSFKSVSCRFQCIGPSLPM